MGRREYPTPSYIRYVSFYGRGEHRFPAIVAEGAAKVRAQVLPVLDRWVEAVPAVHIAEEARAEEASKAERLRAAEDEKRTAASRAVADPVNGEKLVLWMKATGQFFIPPGVSPDIADLISKSRDEYQFFVADPELEKAYRDEARQEFITFFDVDPPADYIDLFSHFFLNTFDGLLII